MKSSSSRMNIDKILGQVQKTLSISYNDNLPIYNKKKLKKMEAKPSPIPTYSTRTKLIIFTLNFISSILIAYHNLCSIFSKSYNPILLFPNTTQQNLLQSLGVSMACIIFLHAISADWMEMVFAKKNNDIYRAHLNSIWNCIFWTTIFVGAWMFRGETRDLFFANHQHLLIGIVDLYIVGRVIFSIGYVVGAGIGLQSFRAVGFGLVFGSVLTMIGQVTGFSLKPLFI